jgi:quinol monooxygenase YgiN
MNTQKFMVRYKLKADRVAENEQRIKAVFRQLHEQHQPEGLRYTVYKLADGVSFVHIIAYEAEAAHEEFVSMPAFRDFVGQAKDRFEEPPITSEVEEIGDY